MTERTERRFCIACGYHIEPHDECKYVECPMRNPIRDTGDALYNQYIHGQSVEGKK